MEQNYGMPPGHGVSNNMLNRGVGMEVNMEGCMVSVEAESKRVGTLDQVRDSNKSRRTKNKE